MANSNSLIIWLLVSTLCGTSRSMFVPQDQLLSQNLTDKCTLLSKCRPVSSYSDSIEVTVSLTPLSFHGVDDPNQIYTVLAEIDFLWHHPCIPWEQNEEWSSVSSFSLAADTTWVPSVQHVNAASDINYVSEQTQTTNVYFYPDGLVTWPLWLELSSSCRLNLKKFPFDKEDCTIQLESWDETVLVKFSTKENASAFLSLERFISPADLWSINGFSSTITNQTYPNWPGLIYSRAVFTFHFERRPQVYVATIILPCFCLIVILLFAVVIPPNSADRPIFCITVVLAYTVLLMTVSNSIPKSSEVPYISIFLAFKLLAGVIASLYTLLTVGLHDKKPFCNSYNLKLRSLISCEIIVIRFVDMCVFGGIALAVVLFDAVIFSLMLE